MKRLFMTLPAICLSLLLCGSRTISEPDRLRLQIHTLRAPDHYWHRIGWKKSVTEGLIESRRSHKPVFLWAFIDYPDEERC
jgi:hypothetical protein